MQHNKILIRQLGLQPYEPVSQAMHEFTDARDEDTLDEIWLVEHHPVFTQGQAGKAEHVLVPGDIPVIQAFSVQTAEDLQRAAESSADYVLLDQGSGGTGKTFDWSLAEGFTRPFLLAGGLGTDNLAEAIERLSPWAVDLSSSLEISGLKDRDKILEAVNIVRSFEQLK